MNLLTFFFFLDTKLHLFVQDTKCKHGKINSLNKWCRIPCHAHDPIKELFFNPFSCKFKCKSMMMNIYYSSNRNNIDDTNKTILQGSDSPNFTKCTSYIDLIHDITRVHLGGCVSSLGATQGCVCIQLHSKEHTLLLQEHTPAGDTAWGLCHLHGHCGLCDAVQAQALWFMVLSCYTADGTAGSYLWHSVHAGSNCGKF